jgi:DNA-binding transcriptional ArsR family regulator
VNQGIYIHRNIAIYKYSMGLTRTELFTDHANEVAELAKVLGHPARVSILRHLIEANACINSDLVNEIGLAQATISQHLRELKAAGLIQGSIDGVRMNYCIDRQGWQKAEALLAGFFTSFPKNKNACCG